MSKSSSKNTLRIIGGEWRSRKLAFPDNPQLRPTPDRVRETLFNWLQNDIYQARCLDLFAGSGALGLEALSRGAGQCVFVESDIASYSQLKQNLATLKTDKGLVIRQDALSYLNSPQESFDIIFIDPPFKANLWSTVLDLLVQHDLITSKSKVYVESSSKDTQLALKEQWRILRDKKAGDVHYQLIQLSDA